MREPNVLGNELPKG